MEEKERLGGRKGGKRMLGRTEEDLMAEVRREGDEAPVEEAK